MTQVIKHQDKILHFIVAGWIFLIPTLLIENPIPGFFLSVGWGISKEIIDAKFDWYDLIADIAGLIFAIICWSF